MAAAKTTAKSTPKKKAAPRKKPGTPGELTVTNPDEFGGQFVEVISGEHKGKQGAIISPLARDTNGVVTRGLLRTRDENTERVPVEYKDLKLKISSGR